MTQLTPVAIRRRFAENGPGSPPHALQLQRGTGRATPGRAAVPGDDVADRRDAPVDGDERGLRARGLEAALAGARAAGRADPRSVRRAGLRLRRARRGARG